MFKFILIHLTFFLISTTDAFASSNVAISDTTWSLETYLDSFVHTKMKEMHVPGAVVTIVRKGKVLFNKGYGYGNIETGRNVDPEKSVFRMASISKPFTAIAIMKMVEEGKLSLREDIRPLISDRYEFNWKYPVTIHHILTHTTGLDYSSIGSHKTEKEDTNPDDKIKLLDQGHQPGDFFGYSNIAFGLLGYLIEKKSGLPYHIYMKENILDPLQMTNSTFDTKLPHGLDINKAETYLLSNGINIKQPRQYLSNPAASSLESTGSDMAKFMHAVLNPSIFEELGIISMKSFNLMTRPKLPEVTNNTIGYSFLLGNNRNNPSIYHSGGVRGFLSLYTIFPTQDLGIFIAQSNRYGAEYFAWSINSKLFDQLLPTVPADLSWVLNQAERSTDIQEFSGYYMQPSLRNSTFEKAENLLINNEVRIDVINDSTLSIFGKGYKRIANTTFLDTTENSERLQQFRIDNKGEVDRFVNATYTYKKLKWYKRTIYKQIIVAISLFIFLLGLIYFIRSFFTKKKMTIPAFQKWILLIGGGYLLSFSALLIAYFIVETVKEGVPLGFKIPIVVLTLCGVLSLAFPWMIYKNIKSCSSTRVKIWNFAGIAAILIVSYIFYDLNLIGFKW